MPDIGRQKSQEMTVLLREWFLQRDGVTVTRALDLRRPVYLAR
jgi:hypothetical protein